MTRLVAITGATGFAGRHAVPELLRRGVRLRALVRRPEAAGLPAAVEVIKGDVNDPDAVKALLSGADAVVHLAGALAALDREGYFRVNEAGTEALAEAALASGIRRFVHVSSLAAREPHLSFYGASKRAGEEAVARRAGALNAVIIRPPAVYGPGDRGTLPLIRALTQPIAAIPGRPDARFSLIHARDLARIVADSIEAQGTGHSRGERRQDGRLWLGRTRQRRIGAARLRHQGAVPAPRGSRRRGLWCGGAGETSPASPASSTAARSRSSITRTG